MGDINTEMVNGANPSMIWSQYMDYLSTKGRQMRTDYAKRMRANNPYTWAELDAMNKELHEQLDALMTWKTNVDNSLEESNTHENMKKNTIKLNEQQLRNVIAESIKEALESRNQHTLEETVQVFIRSVQGAMDVFYQETASGFDDLTPGENYLDEYNYRAYLHKIEDHINIAIKLATRLLKNKKQGTISNA